VLINVYFGKTQLALVLSSVSQDGSDGAAGAAPRSPKIHNHRLIGFEHLGLKISVANVKQVAMSFHYLVLSFKE